MWSYYGSKSKVVDLYPAPKYGRIIEPFAGSARYSLKYFDRDVLLVDKYDVVVRIWQYLQKCNPSDIMRLPDLKQGQTVDDFSLCDEEKWLIGFCINRGSAQPKKSPKDFNSWIDNRKQIADQLFKIKHWQIKLGSFENVDNQQATWFIDPPYQVGGKWYMENNSRINFVELGKWAAERSGQVIVCENTKANWLPFWPIGNLTGAYSNTTEAMWSNDFSQLSLFAAT